VPGPARSRTFLRCSRTAADRGAVDIAGAAALVEPAQG
jgi:hypothetical protein